MWFLSGLYVSDKPAACRLYSDYCKHLVVVDPFALLEHRLLAIGLLQVKTGHTYTCTTLYDKRNIHVKIKLKKTKLH